MKLKVSEMASTMGNLRQLGVPMTLHWETLGRAHGVSVLLLVTAYESWFSQNKMFNLKSCVQLKIPQSFHKQLLDPWGTRCDAEVWPLVGALAVRRGNRKCPGLPRNKSKEHCVQPIRSIVQQPLGTAFMSSIFGHGGVPKAEAWEVCHPLLSSRPTIQTLASTKDACEMQCAICSLSPAPR